jgi:NADH:ubiquinone oxidoreductase subunit 5 (subunit L)/multisubunit Na+/H+ antiporter MnhA subunit
MEGPTPVSSLLHAATMVYIYIIINIKSLYWIFYYQYKKNITICWNTQKKRKKREKKW